MAKKKRGNEKSPYNIVYWDIKQFQKETPFFYDAHKMFWIWDKTTFCYKIATKTELLTLVNKRMELRGWIVERTNKQEYLNALEIVGTQYKPKEPEKNWVQFGSYVTNIKVNHNFGVEGLDATPDYFFTNPIPWDIGKSIQTPTIDKLFKEWVGEEYVQTLYEIIAYCCIRDMPIHLAFALIGSGRNGKSVFQRLLTNFLGQHNCVSTELDLLLDSRFESFKLYRKLACQLGETNWQVMKKTSLFKKLVGGDLIGFEKKNKDPFDDYNYAKVLINSNSLPSSEDTSEGFYRRWLIIDFPNEFPEGKDILQTIPEIEYNNLARKCTFLLPKLLERGQFTNQGTIDQRKNRYINASNPLPFFIRDHCERGSFDLFVSYGELFSAYKEYLRRNKKRVVSRKEFVIGMENEGLFSRKCSKTVGGKVENGWFFEGICLKNDWKTAFSPKNVTNVPNSTKIPLQSLYRDLSEKTVTNGTLVTLTENQKKTKQYEDSIDSFSIRMVEGLIPKFPIRIEELREKKELKNMPLEMFDRIIKKLKHKGDVYEPTNGMIAKL